MPQPSPFHSRTLPLCTSMQWMDWAGFAAVSCYAAHSEREYHAIRQSAALIDVSPLFKYEVTGSDAARALSMLMCRDVSSISRGRVLYTSWVDEAGMMLDDGTVARIGEQHYRVTSSEPWLRWFNVHSQGLDVQFEDSTHQLAALSLQGPNARNVLLPIVDFDMNKMRFFRIRKTRLAGIEVWISRTGYTGDLGYEIWVDSDHAIAVWDALIQAGAHWGLQPCGLDAMDIARIEAGFVLQGVDYVSARNCFLERQKSSPYEAGLGWTVDLDRDPFIGQAALRAEKENGSKWAMVGLEMDWDSLETVCDLYGLPPALSPHAWRCGLPVYNEQGNQQIGYATSGAWSPILKKNLSLATLPTQMAAIGQRVLLEHTVEYQRYKVLATVVERPFFDPPQKRSVPGLEKSNG